jgi:hypothetical protein
MKMSVKNRAILYKELMIACQEKKDRNKPNPKTVHENG